MTTCQLFANLARAELDMIRWGQACRDPSKFYPVVKAEFDRAFDKREALKARALAADPVRYARTYPGNAYGIRHLLPTDMAARIEAAETDAEIVAALSTAEHVAECDAAIAAIEAGLIEGGAIEAPARNTATYCDGKAREFTAVLLSGTEERYAAIAGQTCSDPLDCVALTYEEAHQVGLEWARRRTVRIGTDLTRFYRVIPLPAGWSNDGGAAPAMLPQRAQLQQAKARGPARGERRYVTVRDTETGEAHRVLTSVARVGVAVVVFVPSNRHRAGALGGMLVTHDDIRKAWVFNDEAEARRMLSRNRAPGERVIRAELIADPAAA